MPYIEIKPNTQYYKSESGSTRWKYYDENKVVYSSNTSDLSNATAEQVFTTPSDVKYLRFTLSDNKVDNFILAESSTSIEYESFYNYELCKIGDYKDAIFKNNQLSSYYDSTLDEDGWYIKKEINKVVLDGITNSLIYYGLYGDDNAPLFYIEKSDISLLTNYSSYNVISSKYDVFINSVTPTNARNMPNYKIRGAISSYRIYIRDDRYTNANDINSWLSTHNAEVYYLLKTPTTEKITNSTLISQLEAIETETGTNIFEVSNENNVLPSLNVKRLKELDKLS